MKIKKSSTVVTRNKSRNNKPVSYARKIHPAASGSFVRYNGALTALYQRDMKETDAAAAILANSDIKALKAKYARFEKKA